MRSGRGFTTVGRESFQAADSANTDVDIACLAD
jgi:hypothetical protein